MLDAAYIALILTSSSMELRPTLNVPLIILGQVAQLRLCSLDLRPGWTGHQGRDLQSALEGSMAVQAEEAEDARGRRRCGKSCAGIVGSAFQDARLSGILGIDVNQI